MFLTAGLISLLLSLVLFPIADWVLNTFIPSEIDSDYGLTMMLFQMGIGDLFRYLADELIFSILIPAGILAIIGFTMVLASYFLAKRNSESNTQITATSRPIDKIADN